MKKGDIERQKDRNSKDELLENWKRFREAKLSNYISISVIPAILSSIFYSHHIYIIC